MHASIETYPCNQDDIVRIQHETTGDAAEANATQTGVKAAKHANIAGLKVLSKSNLQNSQRNANKKEGHEIGNKEGSSSIFDRQTRKAPNVSYGKSARAEQLR